MEKRRSTLGSVLLLTAALVWGFAFATQRYAAGFIDSVSLNAIRYIMGAVVLLPTFLITDYLRKKSGRKIIPFNRDTWIGGSLCGAILLVSTLVQQFGLESTTASKAGFITTLYIVFVPIFGLLARRSTSLNSWFAVVIALMGFWIMCVTDDFSVSSGDILIFMCAMTFAFQILFIDVFIPSCDSIKFTFVQFLTASLIGFSLMAANGFPTLQAVEASIVPLLYMGVMSSGVAYTLQVAGQKRTEPALATLIMSLESVFALLGGVILLHESSTPRELLGCIVVFVAVFIAEFKIPRRFLCYREEGFFHQ